MILEILESKKPKIWQNASKQSYRKLKELWYADAINYLTASWRLLALGMESFISSSGGCEFVDKSERITDQFTHILPVACNHGCDLPVSVQILKTIEAGVLVCEFFCPNQWLLSNPTYHYLLLSNQWLFFIQSPISGVCVQTNHSLLLLLRIPTLSERDSNANCFPHSLLGAMPLWAPPVFNPHKALYLSAFFWLQYSLIYLGIF